MSSILALGMGLFAAGVVFASGHGPVFGLATPTAPRHGWSVDLGVMGRHGRFNTGSMLRAALGYGINQNLKLSISGPVSFSNDALPPARVAPLMPMSMDFEAIAAWRFHRRDLGIGSRFETTAYGGLLVPGPQRAAGMMGDLARAPGIYTAVVTGVASRTVYVWGGGGYTRYAARNGDRRPDIISYSGVAGYRPKSWQREFDSWDWRIFAEASGERSGAFQHRGLRAPGTRMHQFLLGPSTLGIYKNYAISAGVQFPVYRDKTNVFERERFRFAVNFAYFF